MVDTYSPFFHLFDCEFQMNTLLLSILFACLVSLSFSGLIPEQHSGIQSYKVRGRLLCGEQPASNVRVKLVDDDFGPDPDDDLDSGYTDMNGESIRT
jgi:hypothetical protein